MRGSRFPASLIGFGAALVIGLLIVGAAVTFFTLPSLDQQLPSGSAPLITQILSPSSGSNAAYGAPIRINVGAMSANTLTELQLWVNGSLAARQTPPADSVEAQMSFDWTPEAIGPHVVIVRAIDSQGYKADSAPLRIEVAASHTQIIQELGVIPEDGKTLTDVAQELDLDVEMLLLLNPGIGADDPLPAETTLVVEEFPADATYLQPPVEPSPQQADGAETGDNALESGSPATSTAFFMPITFWLAGFSGNLPLLPAAPGVSAVVTGCEVTLNINDLSADESGFFVYALKPSAFDFERIETLGAHSGKGVITTSVEAVVGSTQYKVAAFNNGGESPSDPVVVTTSDDACATPDQQVVVLNHPKLILTQPADRVYCYVSADGENWNRLPLSKAQFYLPDANNEVDLSGEIGPLGKPGTPITLYSECWGWAGGALNTLGSAQGDVPSEGGPFSATAQAYMFTGDVDSGAIYTGISFSVTPPLIPFNLEKQVTPPFNTSADLAQNNSVVLNWGWQPSDCDPADEACFYDDAIIGFHVFDAQGTQLGEFPAKGSVWQVHASPVTGTGYNPGDCFTITAYTAESESNASAPACIPVDSTPPVRSLIDAGLAAPTNLHFAANGKECLDHVTGLGKLLVGSLCEESAKQGNHVLVWDYTPAATEPDGFNLYELDLNSGLFLLRDVSDSPDQTVSFVPFWATGGNRCFMVRAYKGFYESENSGVVCGTQPTPKEVTLTPAFGMVHQYSHRVMYSDVICPGGTSIDHASFPTYPPESDNILILDHYSNLSWLCSTKWDIKWWGGAAFDIQPWHGQQIEKAVLTFDMYESLRKYRDFPDHSLQTPAPSCIEALYHSRLNLADRWYGTELISSGPFGYAEVVGGSSIIKRDTFDVTELLRAELAESSKIMRFLVEPDMAVENPGEDRKETEVCRIGNFRLTITRAGE